MKRSLVLAAAAILALLLAALVAAPAALAIAWLWAFAFLSMIAIGSLALLLVGAITGGRWVCDLAPVLVPAARTLPLFVLAFIPLLLWRAHLYDWAALGLAPDVARACLNPLFFDLRGLAGLAVWSLLAWGRVWETRLGAALGLTLHTVLLTFLPADWILTLPPGGEFAGFGLGFGIEQMFAALAFAALLAPQGDDRRANRDLAGLLMTTLLGTVYFFFMQYIITWYGNIPHKVAWYALRDGAPWAPLFLAGFALGAVLPFFAMLHPELRSRPGSMRVLGALVLTGVGLHTAWMILPGGDVAAIVLPLAAGTIILAVLAAWPWMKTARLRHG